MFRWSSGFQRICTMLHHILRYSKMRCMLACWQMLGDPGTQHRHYLTSSFHLDLIYLALLLTPSRSHLHANSRCNLFDGEPCTSGLCWSFRLQRIQLGVRAQLTSQQRIKLIIPLAETHSIHTHIGSHNRNSCSNAFT